MKKELDEKSEWTRIREKLNQNYKYDDTWKEAINLFKNRLERTFLNPIQLIIDTKRREGEGFTIVTVQCALIEMLSAFRQGKIFNHKTKRSSPKYEYKNSEEMFTSLLLEAPIFQDIFWKLNKKNNREKNQPYNASDFYKYVRCGLMHEARTKGNWHITTAPKSVLVKSEKRFIIKEDGKNKIYRTVLHYRLLNYLDDYYNELRQDTQDGEKLRKYFARKLDHLFELDPDLKYDWWTE